MVLDWPGKRNDAGDEHPAVYHMLDVAAVAEVLTQGQPEPLRQAFVLLAALHDLGKVGAPFRAMLREGRAQEARHWEYTEVLLEHHDAALDEVLGSRKARRLGLYAATAGHHGRPPWRERWERRALRQLGAEAVADSGEVIRIFAGLWPEASLDGLSLKEVKALSWWLPGLVAAADWIGSNERWFGYVPAGPEPLAYLQLRREVAVRAVEEAGLLSPGVSRAKLFDFPALRPMQEAVSNAHLPDGPMVAVIEDETGAGKTEAALLLAQRMMAAGKGRGLYFALPTMATANAMFARAKDSVGAMFDGAPSLALAHGRAATSAAFRDLVAQDTPETDEPVCTEWLADNRRRALLATVGVGTVDQAFLSVLPTKHAALRHYGLASKILIVDEVHEMGEPYMGAELERLLQAHRMAGGSAILLTATLPLAQRAKLLAAYGVEDKSARAYPALTIGETAPVVALPSKRGPVAVERLAAPEDAVALLRQRAEEGAACLWVRNAVDDAIDAVAVLRAQGVEADLLHARFALADRLRHEGAALERFGKNGEGREGRVLVATQVVESSLDLDFDVMVSDLAPVAALIQRAGRLWRHMDLRPAAGRSVAGPVLHVVAPDPADVSDAQWLARVLDRGAWVYPLDLQWRTADELFRRGQIDAPGGLRDLIEAVHGVEGGLPEALEDAEMERIAKGYSATSHARGNLVDLSAGYRSSGGADDASYPTRLGRPVRTLMLTVEEGGALGPYGGDGVDGAQLSEVSAAESRLAGLDLPDQEGPLVTALIAKWPEWRKKAVTVCPLGEDGRICEGLRYDPKLGLLFE